MVHDNEGQAKQPLDLSVILCTWNNSRRLAITLSAISECEIPEGLRWEVVVVANNCTDDTEEVANRFAGRLPIIYVSEPRQGLSHARNAGLQVANGKLILFTDDDVKPSREWIALYWAAFRAMPEGCYFGGPVESEFEGGTPESELLRMAPWSVQGLGWGPDDRPLRPGEAFIAANWACPAEALRAVGGFDPTRGLDPSSGEVRVGEETDLMNRLRANGLSPWYLAQARIRHLVPADKCSLAHIAARKEASAYEEMRSSSAGWRQRTILRVKSIVHLFRWRCARMMGRPGYREYVAWRMTVGRIRALRERSS